MNEDWSSTAMHARERLLARLRSAATDGTLVKLTLSKPAKAGAECRNVFVRPVTLKSGAQLSLVWRYATRDVTKNHPASEALPLVESLIGVEFQEAHLYTRTDSMELRCGVEGKDRLRTGPAQPAAGAASTGAHDRAKLHPIAATSPWLRALGVTNEHGAPKQGMSAKYRQIEKYAELLQQLLGESKLLPRPANAKAPLRIVDMGCGKGYLTFAVAALAGPDAEVLGVELRPELAARCNDIARETGFANLHFQQGSISDAPLENPDAVIALHACDTATDDALARGIAAQASLLVVAPCCQKELRPQLQAPAVLADALRHGIFQERQAEFVTDALRAELLEYAGYHTRVFEFISTEHTAKNVMIAAVRRQGPSDEERAGRIRALARQYGIRHHALASHLGFALD